MSYKVIFDDCLQALKKMPPSSVDAVITDPPYCSGGFSESGKSQAKGQGLRSEIIEDLGWFSSDNMTSSGFSWLMRLFSMEIERVLKINTNFLVFTDWRMVPLLAPIFESVGFQYKNMIIWNKGQVGLGNGFRPQHEIILHFVKGKANFYSMTVGNVITTKRINTNGRLHQTQKPVELIAKLLEVVTKEGDTVLDPFFGSGSTGEACLKMRRNIIGIEKGERYVQIAEKRLEEVQQEIKFNLFSKEEE